MNLSDFRIKKQKGYFFVEKKVHRSKLKSWITGISFDWVLLKEIGDESKCAFVSLSNATKAVQQELTGEKYYQLVLVDGNIETIYY